MIKKRRVKVTAERPIAFETYEYEQSQYDMHCDICDVEMPNWNWHTNLTIMPPGASEPENAHFCDTCAAKIQAFINKCKEDRT